MLWGPPGGEGSAARPRALGAVQSVLPEQGAP